MLQIRDAYLDLDKKETPADTLELRSAENFTQLPDAHSDEDVLVIDKNLKNVDYKLAKCCNPIYGDPIFGFVSVSGGIKIHRQDCPNAPQMIARFGYRIVNARWSGKPVDARYPITLRIVGHDDIGIVTNVTSIISKEQNIMLRSISIDSDDGLFQGHLTVMLTDTHELEGLIKKLKIVKGVKSVERV